MYTQKDICIVHLSDLHIKSMSQKNVKLPNVFKNLTKDIDDHTSNFAQCVIVVSGDTINEAMYTRTNRQAVLEFFRMIKSKIHSEVVEIIFTPGNHDVKRNESYYDQNLLEMEKKYESESFELLGYKDYLSLVNEVRNVFNLPCIDTPFYCKSVIINGFRVNFVSLDLAWNTVSDTNNKTMADGLKIGEYQKVFLKEEFHSMNNPDVVVFVSHYPLSWLNHTDYSSLLRELLSEDGYMADIYLCGHIHDVDTINYSTHENSLLTLVTGIGWPQNFNEEQKSDRRYSIYEINPVRNSCCIIMRKSKHNSDFDYDYTIYTNENEQSSRKIVYPLRSPQKDLPYLSMATPERINEKSFLSHQK